jgi:hypothetical protein
MTVGELKKILEDCREDAEIGISYIDEDTYTLVGDADYIDVYPTLCLIADRPMDYDEICDKVSNILKNKESLLESGLLCLNQVEAMEGLLKVRYER